MSWDGLTQHRRDPIEAENLGRGNCSLPKDSSERCPLLNSLQGSQHTLSIPELKHSSLHGLCHSTTCLDGIDTNLIAEPINTGNGIQIKNPQV